MLPYVGTYAQLGVAIENGLRLALEQSGANFGGSEVDFFKVDDESEPSKATDNANRLITRDKIDVLVGSVHSGVAMGMHKVAKESGTLMLIPNAGADAATGALCAPNVFHTSFSNWQPVHPLAKVMADKGHKEKQCSSPGNRRCSATWGFRAPLLHWLPHSVRLPCRTHGSIACPKRRLSSKTIRCSAMR